MSLHYPVGYLQATSSQSIRYVLSDLVAKVRSVEQAAVSDTDEEQIFLGVIITC